MAIKKELKYKGMVQYAIWQLQKDADLFCEMVDELDSYMGYADEFRCYPMDDLDELNYGMKLSDFLHKITSDFSLNDNWFYYSIWGIESTDDREALYRSKVDEGELLDNILEYSNHLPFFNNKDFEEHIEKMLELKEEIENEDV